MLHRQPIGHFFDKNRGRSRREPDQLFVSGELVQHPALDLIQDLVGQTQTLGGRRVHFVVQALHRCPDPRLQAEDVGRVDDRGQLRIREHLLDIVVVRDRAADLLGERPALDGLLGGAGAP